jgi:hypothetical protein
MVSQLLKIITVKPSFDYIKNVYEPCLERYLKNPQTIRNAINSINNGRKILQSNEEVDTYIAFYGAQHYYKLVEAFDALDISRFCDRELEIISYGCGAATDTCSLISYCRSKQINLLFKNLTLIEPSRIALERGIEYLNAAISNEEYKQIKINLVNKYLDNLEKKDIYSECKALKIHIFSNILDLDVINLNDLASIIKNTQSGINYFICISPKKYGGQQRIDDFYQEIFKLIQRASISNIDTNNTDFKQTIWSMKENCYTDNFIIDRYHKIFEIKFT